MLTSPSRVAHFELTTCGLTRTGPTLSGCAISSGAKSMTIDFDTAMLRGDKVLLQKYSAPIFTPYYHGHGNPGWHRCDFGSVVASPCLSLPLVVTYVSR